jgi:hypothetical protein
MPLFIAGVVGLSYLLLLVSFHSRSPATMSGHHTGQPLATRACAIRPTGQPGDEPGDPAATGISAGGVSRLVVRIARLCVPEELIRIGGDPNLAPSLVARPDGGRASLNQTRGSVRESGGPRGAASGS